MERDCESELSKLNIEQNACIYHFGASVIHGQRSNILRLQCIYQFDLFLIDIDKGGIQIQDTSEDGDGHSGNNNCF